MPHDSTQHAQHDPLLVASLAAGDLTGADRDLATSLITNCAECATLHDDLVAIARVTAALPTAVRSRDFQLTPEQAAHLRPGGWRRLVGAFASPRLAMTRQLGIGLTTLGLAGLLVSVIPATNLGGSAAGAPAGPAQAASTSEDARLPGVESAASAAASAAPPAAAASASEPAPSASQFDTAGPLASASASGSYGALSGPGSSPSQERTSSSYGDGTGGNVTAQGSNGGKSTTAPAPGQRDLLIQTAAENSGPSLMLVASAILLAAGIALLVARRIARGLTDR